MPESLEGLGADVIACILGGEPASPGGAERKLCGERPFLITRAKPAGPARVGTRAAPASSTTAHLNMRLSFASGSATLTPAGRRSLGALARVIRTPAYRLRGARFVIEGHTDAVGSRANNLLLSRRRATAAAVELARHGVARDRVTAVGRGPDRPLAGVEPSDGANRRVEITRS